MPTNNDIIVSNGFDRFHLMHAAAELADRGRLAACFTGFYPGPIWRGRLRTTRLDRLTRISRLFDRDVTLPADRLISTPLLEGLNFVGAQLRNEWIKKSARHLFARRVAELLTGIGASIFHYRSGFGHLAVKMAKARGMIALCDHSIAHPELVEHLVAHKGRYPLPQQTTEIGCLWKDVAVDVHQADAVLVCSDFVKDTFLKRGCDPSRLHVIYYGVDDHFLACVDDLLATSEARMSDGEQLRLIFAGAISRRKGVPELVQALSGLSGLPWTLDLVGPVDPDISVSYGAFLADPRVTLSGVLSRRELARHLINADALLFPSLAEGSARIVFDALAAGCYVITTQNAGSIVQSDVHGALIEPGDVIAIQNAVRRAAADRAMVAAIGRHNADEIRRKWRKSQYGEKLIELYDQLSSVARAASSDVPLSNSFPNMTALSANQETCARLGG